MYEISNYNDYLMHHGVDGQEWGKRNGPPYPLKASSKLQAKLKEKRRTNILNDPKKLKKHKSEFTIEEIEEANRKFKALKDTESYIPQKERKQKRKQKGKELSKTKTQMINTPDKFLQNQHLLSEREQAQALDYLDRQDKAKRMKYDQRLTRNIPSIIRAISDMAGSAANIVDKVSSIKDRLSRVEDVDPYELTTDEKHAKYLLDRLGPNDYQLLINKSNPNRKNKKKN